MTKSASNSMPNNKKHSNRKDIQSEAIQSLYRVATVCRMCKSKKLTLYLDLGLTPPADQFRTRTELDLPEIFYPLRVLLCENCGLSQLSHVVNPRVLYQHDYPYEQSTTKTGQLHWDNFARVVAETLHLEKNDLVVDIGSNVGTLLNSFKKEGMRVIGVDPAPNIVAIANKENGIKTLCDFFGMGSAKKIRKMAGQASVVVGANVFAHIDDLHSVMRAVKFLLKKNGVFIFESPYFQHLVDNLEYDTVYHEHLSYLSIKPLIPFFAKFGMEIFLVQQAHIHGGSFRVFVGKRGAHAIDPTVGEFILREETRKLHNIETMKIFAQRVTKNREDLTKLLENLLSQGKSIVAVSAPAKGMTLINYVGLTNRHIKFISEKARLKIGRFAPGGHAGGYIPVVSDETLFKDRPDYAILLAWNFSTEIVDNLRQFSEQGGQFIIPIPNPIIVGGGKNHGNKERGK